MATCATCGREKPDAELLMGGDGPICADCQADADLAAAAGGSHSPAIVGAIAGGIPFFVTVSTSSQTTVNGVVTSSSSTDYVAIAGGAIALGAALFVLWGAMRSPAKRMEKLGAGVAVLALGAFQLSRGFGMF